MSELKTPDTKDYIFYQCIINHFNNIECNKLDKENYILLENSKLVPVRKIYPEFLHKFIIKSEMTPKKVFTK